MPKVLERLEPGAKKPNSTGPVGVSTRKLRTACKESLTTTTVFLNKRTHAACPIHKMAAKPTMDNGDLMTPLR